MWAPGHVQQCQSCVGMAAKPASIQVAGSELAVLRKRRRQLAVILFHIEAVVLVRSPQGC